MAINFKKLAKRSLLGAVDPFGFGEKAVNNLAKGKPAGVIGGALKGAGSTLAGASSLGQQALDSTVGKGLDFITGEKLTPTKTANQTFSKALKPKGRAEKVGFAAERIAEFLVPSSKIANLERGVTASIAGRGAGLAKVGIRAGVEAVYNGGLTAAQQGTFRNDAKTAALVGALFPVGGAVLGAGRKLVGKGVTAVGEQLLQKQIKPLEGAIKEGFDIANVKKYGLAKGNLPQMLTSTENKIHSLYDDLTKVLEKTNQPHSINLNEVFESTTKRLTKGDMPSRAKLFGEGASTTRYLDNLKEEIANVSGATGEVDNLTAQIVKQASGRKGAWAYKFPDKDSTAIERVYNTFYDEIKKSLEKVGGSEVASINKQISELIPISHALIKRIPVRDRQNALSMVDNMSLFGAILNPKALAITGVDRILKNPRFANFITRAGEKYTKVPKSGIGKRFLGN
jgi:hypothetical protein